MSSKATVNEVPTNSKDASDAVRVGVDSSADQGWEQIRESLRGLRYGSVEIIVQDGVIVQIERIEKRRTRIPVDKVK
jgi:hypothetical protein